MRGKCVIMLHHNSKCIYHSEKRSSHHGPILCCITCSIQIKPFRTAKEHFVETDQLDDTQVRQIAH